MERILISSNSFKECADSVSISELIKSNLESIKDVELIVKPISDGGDGFLKVCHFYVGGQFRHYEITTPYDESTFDCPVLYCESKKEMYIESAEVLGLKKVPIKHRKPLQLSSKGLGELINRVQEEVENKKLILENIYIGIGGTATIDLGMGMMSKLGLSLLDSGGNKVTVIPKKYLSVSSIKYNPRPLSFTIKSVVDVASPLLGEMGGVIIFGSQKGATNDDISCIENGFSKLINLFGNKGLDVSSNILSGAGGGIPSALQIFFKSPIITSQEFILDKLELDNIKDSIDYLITGEGAYDSQSQLGKGAGLLVKMFTPRSEKVFIICGKADKASKEIHPANVKLIELNKYFSSDSESIRNYELGIQKACEEIRNQIKF